LKLVIQRVKRASLTANGTVRATISRGLFILAGSCKTDTPEDAVYLAGKIAKLRIFEDEAGKMNLDVRDSGGEVLIASQFTLHANTRRGNRPSFDDAAPPSLAEPLIIMLADELKSHGVTVRTGVFGAHMEIDMLCDGPVTIIIDSDERKIPRRQA
jgi:D-aminoacyl-tRNA deacylase